MQIISRKTIVQEKFSIPCPKCGSVRVLIQRIPGKVPLNKMKKKFFYSRVIKCTNKKCNAIWNDQASIVKPKDYDGWLKSKTASLFENTAYDTSLNLQANRD